MEEKRASINPVTMEEEFSKELLLSQASFMMQNMINSWPDLVVDDICQTSMRATEYKGGKVHEGSVGWHLCVGSCLMGIAKQVEIIFPIRGGHLIEPAMATTPQGEEISLNPVRFSNWCRLGIR